MSDSTSNRSRLRRSLRLIAGCWLLLGWFLLSDAKAAVIYSGVQDITVTNNLEGVYIDIGSGTPTFPGGDPDAVGNDTYTVGYSEPANWDINIFFGGAGIAFSDTFSPFVDGTSGDSNAITQGSQILNVAAGTVIQPLAATRAVATNLPGGSGTPVGGSGENHFATPDLNNATFSAFPNDGSRGYIAFVVDTGSGDQYGWMEVTLYNGGSTGTIHAWAYSDEASFEVGQIPEPSSFMLVLLASLGLLRRRRI